MCVCVYVDPDQICLTSCPAACHRPIRACHQALSTPVLRLTDSLLCSPSAQIPLTRLWRVTDEVHGEAREYSWQRKGSLKRRTWPSSKQTIQYCWSAVYTGEFQWTPFSLWVVLCVWVGLQVGFRLNPPPLNGPLSSPVAVPTDAELFLQALGRQGAGIVSYPILYTKPVSMLCSNTPPLLQDEHRAELPAWGNRRGNLENTSHKAVISTQRNNGR